MVNEHQCAERGEPHDEVQLGRLSSHDREQLVHFLFAHLIGYGGESRLLFFLMLRLLSERLLVALIADIHDAPVPGWRVAPVGRLHTDKRRTTVRMIPADPTAFRLGSSNDRQGCSGADRL